jgi:type VI secretion system protein ImpF
MAAGDNGAGPVLSILDRLTETQPALNSWDEIRQLRASLCDDLTALLNTRRAEEDFDSSYQEAANSLLTFGVADFTSYNLTNAVEQERLRRSIERAIRQFEPRLTRVAVSLQEPNPLSPTLRFQIEALLRTGSPGEALLLDVTLQRDSRRVAVSGTNL